MEIGLVATLREAYSTRAAWAYDAELALIRDAWGDEGVALAEAYAQADYADAGVAFAQFVAHVMRAKHEIRRQDHG
jgi:hypothetical protein